MNILKSTRRILVLTATIGLAASFMIAGRSAAADTPVPVDESAPAYHIKNTTRLQWVDPDGRQPTSYDEWLAQFGIKGPLETETVFTGRAMKSSADGIGFGIFVETSLYGALESSLYLFALDLTGEGYDVITTTISGGSPESFRALLQSHYAAGMEGCLLVGDLPVPWYENIPESRSFPTSQIHGLQHRTVWPRSQKTYVPCWNSIMKEAGRLWKPK